MIRSVLGLCNRRWPNDVCYDGTRDAGRRWMKERGRVVVGEKGRKRVTGCCMCNKACSRHERTCAWGKRRSEKSGRGGWPGPGTAREIAATDRVKRAYSNFNGFPGSVPAFFSSATCTCLCTTLTALHHHFNGHPSLSS